MSGHVVMFGGGLASYGVLRRVVDQEGPASVLALIADTGTEDADLWRFTYQIKESLGVRFAILRVPLVADGGDVWDLFDAQGMIGNTRADLCSRMMKREPLRRYIEERFSPADTTVYLGFDATEEHRFDRSKPHWAPWMVRAPLIEGAVWKDQCEAEASAAGIAPPRLYALGFAHNNCGGFCIKAGHGAFITLLKQMPERFAYHERREAEFRARTGKDVAILRDRTGGTTSPLTLAALRERHERTPQQIDMFDIGGCECFMPSEDAPAPGTGEEGKQG